MKKRNKIKNLSHKDDDSSSPAIRIAVAQICQSVGYRGAQTSALETLTDVAIRYLRSLAASAASSSASTGRTDSNLLDIIRALEDLYSILGFRGNSEIKSRLFLADSSILIDTMKFVHRSREIPFAQPLPRCRHVAPANPPCFSDSRFHHVPRWLPAFPIVEKPAVNATDGEISSEKIIPRPAGKMGKLPAKRKKVSFKINNGGGGNNKRIELGFGYGICKGGKRISCQNYEDDDEKVVNVSNDDDFEGFMKRKFGELGSRMKMILNS